MPTYKKQPINLDAGFSHEQLATIRAALSGDPCVEQALTDLRDGLDAAIISGVHELAVSVGRSENAEQMAIKSASIAGRLSLARKLSGIITDMLGE